jgi:hypothetical protein
MLIDERATPCPACSVRIAAQRSLAVDDRIARARADVFEQRVQPGIVERARGHGHRRQPQRTLNFPETEVPGDEGRPSLRVRYLADPRLRIRPREHRRRRQRAELQHAKSDGRSG